MLPFAPRPIGRDPASPYPLPRARAFCALQAPLAALLCVLLLASVALPRTVHAQAAATPAASDAVVRPEAPFAVAVLPFEDRRHPGRAHWLARYLRERVALALVREPRAAVLGLETAEVWRDTLPARPGVVLPADAWKRMGVQVVLRASMQEVLGLVELRLHAEVPTGDLLDEAGGRLRFSLREETPAEALERLLSAVQAALLPAVRLEEPRPPAAWSDVESLYTLLGEPVVPGDRAVRPGLVGRLRAWTAHPALAGRAHQALAQLLLEQAQLYLPEGAGRRLLLQEALQHATAAQRADPLDSQRLALKAQLHVLLDMHYEAKTEASIARLRNPLEALAFVVLAQVAGLSTGEATEHLKRAVATDPYLRTATRPAGVAPYLGGILEPTFVAWEKLRASGGLARSGDTGDYGQRLRDGIAAFERKAWEEAERLLRSAAEQSDGDFTPWLYLHRILLELGHPGEAVTGLRRLAAENPQEPDVLLYLGVALEDSGEPEPAQDAYRKALAERPEDLRAQFGIASTDVALERWPQALAGLRRVLHADPQHAEAWLALGRVHLHEQDWSAAEQALQHALELTPDSEDARDLLAEAKRKGGGKPNQ